MSDILSYLFETNAIKFYKDNEPLWYTSGKIGPYYINTQYSYGSEKEATDFLNYIADELVKIKNGSSNKVDLPGKMFNQVLKQYQNNKIYNFVINQMKNYIETNIGVDKFEYISGGERRDWFFSIIIAHLLNKPHITLFKDMSSLLSDSNFTTTTIPNNLNGAKVLHLADLVNTASSYEKMWVPIVHSLNGVMENTLAVINRNQNGQNGFEVLKQLNVIPHCLVTIDRSLFSNAFKLNLINQTQLDLLNRYFDNPDDTMKQFLIEHPEFIENSLKSTNERTLKRVHTLIDEDLYGLNLKK